MPGRTAEIEADCLAGGVRIGMQATGPLARFRARVCPELTGGAAPLGITVQLHSCPPLNPRAGRFHQST